MTLHTHRNDGANDKGVVVSEDNVVGPLEARMELNTAILLCSLQCTTGKHEAAGVVAVFITRGYDGAVPAHRVSRTKHAVPCLSPLPSCTSAWTSFSSVSDTDWCALYRARTP
jgi:hypothetical protein